MTVPDMPICTDRTTSPVLQRGDRQAESQQEDDSAEGGAPSFYSRDQVGPYGEVPYGGVPSGAPWTTLLIGWLHGQVCGGECFQAPLRQHYSGRLN